MEKIFLSLLLLTAHVYGSTDILPDDRESLSSKLSSSQNFLVAVKDIAKSMGCSKSLETAEYHLSRFSETYRYNNLLANVIFNASVISPELREKAGIISVILSADDLNNLHEHLLRVGHYITEIAKAQGVDHLAPFLSREMNQIDAGAFVGSSTVLAVVNECEHKHSLLFSAGAIFSEVFRGRDKLHDCNEQMLLDILHNFERVATVVPFIKVSEFKRVDYSRMEEISHSLDVIKPVLRKARII
jgi:hypothetical protein